MPSEPVAAATDSGGVVGDDFLGILHHGLEGAAVHQAVELVIGKGEHIRRGGGGR